MNPLRALVRDVVNLVSSEAVKQPTELGLRRALEQRVVPPVVDLGRYRDSFEDTARRAHESATPAPKKSSKSSSWSSLSFSSSTEAFATGRFNALQRDGFEAPRRVPVNLLGRAAMPEALPRSAPRSNGFTASLHDLG